MSRSDRTREVSMTVFRDEARVAVEAWRLGNGSVVFVDPYEPGLRYFSRPGAWRRAVLVPADQVVPAARLLGEVPDGRKVRWLTASEQWDVPPADITAVRVVSRVRAAGLAALLDAAYPQHGTRDVVEAWTAIRHPLVSAAALDDGRIGLTLPDGADGRTLFSGLVEGAGGRPVPGRPCEWQLPPSQHAANVAFWYGAELWLPLFELPRGSDWRPWIRNGVDPGRVALFWRAGVGAAEAAISPYDDDALRVFAALAQTDPNALRRQTLSALPSPTWKS